MLVEGGFIWDDADYVTGNDLLLDLEGLWRLWLPQMDAYVTRALDPSTAPSYGVPGDL